MFDSDNLKIKTKLHLELDREFGALGAFGGHLGATPSSRASQGGPAQLIFTLAVRLEHQTDY